MSECAICLDPIVTEEKPMLPCTHVFHGRCLVRWLALTPECPTCRAHVTRTPVELILQRTKDDLLFDAFRELRRTPSACLTSLFPKGSIYEAALTRALAVFSAVDDEDRRENLAMMLFYLHIGGDTRASPAAKEPSGKTAMAIARGLVRWSTTGCLK